ncbi:MAG: hypothetical protein FD146_2429 [Anaerolineaceae bacterium]|nr:MAG: hypothetical protein FD146_2429 [Anaerolineaceae bacterium]
MPLIFVMQDTLNSLSCLSPVFGIIAIMSGILGINTAKKLNGVGRNQSVLGLVFGIIFSLLYGLLYGAFFLAILIGFSQAMNS